MIICKDCGNSAESVDGFCSSCGSLLEWSGQQVPGANRAAALTARQPAAERARPEPLPAMAEPVHAGPYCMACGVRNPHGRTFCRSCGAVLRADGTAGQQRPGWWRRARARLRGRPVTAADGGTAASRPAAAPQAAASTPPPAASTAGAAKRVPHHHMPGHLLPQRPAARRVRRIRPGRWALAIRYSPVFLVVCAVAVGFSPARSWITGHISQLGGKVGSDLGQHYVSQFPVSSSAASAAPGHAAGLAIDDNAASYWLTAGGGTGASITIRFATPVKIDAIGILPGLPGAAYLTQARPEAVLVSDGQDPAVPVTFTDQQAFQRVVVHLRDVTTITLTIKSAYPGQQGQAIAIRSLQFSDLVGGAQPTG